MTKENPLPAGWMWVKVGEIAESINPGFPSGKHNQGGVGIPHIRPMNISRNGDIDLSVVKYVQPKDYSPLLEGDVLFNNTNSPELVGKTTYIRQSTNWAYSNHMTRIRLHTESAFAGWVANALHYLYLEGYFKLNCRHHVNQASVASGFLAESVSIPLPPIKEQKLIVAKIDELFSQLDAGTVALRRIQAGLKRYKASVLKAAFKGRLTTQEPFDESVEELLKRFLHNRQAFQEANIRVRGKSITNLVEEGVKSPSISQLPTLPDKWSWVTWEMILAPEKGAFRRGPFGSTLKKSIFVESGYKVYEQYCPINDDCSFGRYYITPELFEKLRSFEVKPGDYLISCSGVTLGRITRVPKGSEKGIINQALLRVRINEKIIIHDYFLYYFRSPFFQEQLFDSSTGTAIPNVKGVKELKALPIPLPPLDEQKRIVSELERRFSIINKVDITVTAGLARADRLRQAILKRAFEGRLVPQDSSGEPAGLLESAPPAAKAKAEPTPRQARLFS